MIEDDDPIVRYDDESGPKEVPRLAANLKNPRTGIPIQSVVTNHVEPIPVPEVIRDTKRGRKQKAVADFFKAKKILESLDRADAIVERIGNKEQMPISGKVTSREMAKVANRDAKLALVRKYHPDCFCGCGRRIQSWYGWQLVYEEGVLIAVECWRCNRRRRHDKRKKMLSPADILDGVSPHFIIAEVTHQYLLNGKDIAALRMRAKLSLREFCELHGLWNHTYQHRIENENVEVTVSKEQVMKLWEAFADKGVVSADDLAEMDIEGSKDSD